LELASSYTKLAGVFRHTARPEEAEDACRKAVVICEKLVSDSPSEPKYRVMLGKSQKRLGQHLVAKQPLEAVKMCRMALSNVQQAADECPEDSTRRQEVVSCWQYLGAMLWRAKQFEEAEWVLRRGLALQEKLEADFPGTVDSHVDSNIAVKPGIYHYLGNALRDAGRTGEAVDAYRKAVAVYERLKAHSRCPPRSLGKLLLREGRPAEAKTFLQQAVRDWELTLDTNPKRQRYCTMFYNSWWNLFRALLRLGEYEEARKAAAHLAPNGIIGN
jgi:tetratricopeptide (TPR) repeat protein